MHLPRRGSLGSVCGLYDSSWWLVIAIVGSCWKKLLIELLEDEGRERNEESAAQKGVRAVVQDRRVAC